MKFFFGASTVAVATFLVGCKDDKNSGGGLELSTKNFKSVSGFEFRFLAPLFSNFVPKSIDFRFVRVLQFFVFLFCGHLGLARRITNVNSFPAPPLSARPILRARMAHFPALSIVCPAMPRPAQATSTCRIAHLAMCATTAIAFLPRATQVVPLPPRNCAFLTRVYKKNWWIKKIKWIINKYSLKVHKSSGYTTRYDFWLFKN